MSEIEYRDRTGRVRFDLCPVCKRQRKTYKSEMCRGCTADKRLSPWLEKLPAPGKADYFPAKGRYGILAVSGCGGENKPGTTLSVLDGHRNWEEIARVYAKSRDLDRKRAELLEWVKHLNRYETV